MALTLELGSNIFMRLRVFRAPNHPVNDFFMIFHDFLQFSSFQLGIAHTSMYTHSLGTMGDYKSWSCLVGPTFTFSTTLRAVVEVMFRKC